MTASTPNSAESKPKLRWYQFSLNRCLIFLLALEVLQLLCDRFHWFPNAWTGLISTASAGLACILMTLWFATSTLVRRRFQYSLRTLLIFVTLLGCSLGWLGIKVREARQQQNAVKSIQKLGAAVAYDYERDSKGVSIHDAKAPGPAWLHALLGDDFFRNIYAVGFVRPSNITDADLELLKALTTLKELDLNETQVTDAGLQNLNGLMQLKELSLCRTQVTDSGVAKLQKALPKCDIYH